LFAPIVDGRFNVGDVNGSHRVRVCYLESRVKVGVWMIAAMLC